MIYALDEAYPGHAAFAQRKGSCRLSTYSWTSIEVPPYADHTIQSSCDLIPSNDAMPLGMCLFCKRFRRSVILSAPLFIITRMKPNL